MCIWFGYNCKNIFCCFFHIVNFVIFHPQYIDNGYLLWAQLLLQFCTDHFETLHMFSSWYEDVHVVCIYMLDHFLLLFSHCELHFSPIIYKQLVPLVSATPLTILYRLLWNFAYVFFMVWGCACGLDVIVWFFFTFFHIENSIVWRCACAFHIIHVLIFITFFCFLNFVIYWPQMYRQLVPCDCNFSYNFKPSFWNFAHFLLGLQKCTWFGYDF